MHFDEILMKLETQNIQVLLHIRSFTLIFLKEHITGRSKYIFGLTSLPPEQNFLPLKL